MKKDQLIMAVVLFVLLVASRLIPHPHNFTALSGVALFAGALWRGPILRFAVPLVAIFLSDLYFGLYPGALWTYLGVAATVVIAPRIGSSVLSVTGRAAAAAVIFFVLSNFGVWVNAGLYPLNLQGFVQCYTMAIPFFHNTLLSSIFYSVGLFTVYRLAFYDAGLVGFVSTNQRA